MVTTERIGTGWHLLAPERTEDRPTLLTVERPPQPWTKFAAGGAEWRQRHNQERRVCSLAVRRREEAIAASDQR